MKPFALAATVGLLVACAPARTAPTTAPAPVAGAVTPASPTPDAPNAPDVAAAPNAPNASPAPTMAPSSSASQPPQDWQALDGADGFAGIGLKRAERELLAGRQPRREVLVAVIDGGVDTAHVDLRARLWANPKETPAPASAGVTARDGDGDGLVGDVFGWNFIGGADGRDVDQDTYEVTRLHARCATKSLGGDSVATLCPKVDAEFAQTRANAERESQEIAGVAAIVDETMRTLRRAIRDSVTPARVRALTATTPELQQARARFLQMAASGITPEVIEEARKDAESGLKYKLNPSFDPRPLVGDTYTDLSQRRYGNADVMGPDAKHGSHVTGIIGGVRDHGVMGIAPAGTRIMMVRAVPDGDERDKDIANAIRFAVDHGAQIINMSFGKGWSPQKAAVDDAVRYADAHGVLMVHAAGNDGEDIAKKPSFPTPFYLGGGRAANWLEIGASSWKGGEHLASEFSNYSTERVDVFAPGSDIFSTVPGGYERLSGTSMAAPVVSGAAALLMSYFPDLTAADVKRILLASATRYANQRVIRPGSDDDRVPFASLSATGGIVNVYAAVKMALAREVKQ